MSSQRSNATTASFDHASEPESASLGGDLSSFLDRSRKLRSRLRVTSTHTVPLTTPGVDPSQVVLTNQPLGHGSFGSVYRGTFSGLPVAIKICAAPKQTDSPSAVTSVQHFRRETARYHHLRHPCIVQFFCVVHHAPSNNLLLVTELMKGGSLFNALRALRHAGVSALPHATLLRLATHIANGLAYLHASSFSFGDLKSMNVLLSEPIDAQRGLVKPTTHAKLCDFGLSRNLKRLVPSTADPPGLSSKGPVGTFAYLAPEAFTNSCTTNAEAAKAADIYALSIVLWELGTLHAPWPNRQPLQLVRLVAKERRRPSWPVCNKLPTRYVRLVQRCWCHDPARRPSAQKVARELASILDESGPHELPSSVAPTSPYRRSRFSGMGIDKSLMRASVSSNVLLGGSAGGSGTSVSSGSSGHSAGLGDNRKERGDGRDGLDDDVLVTMDDTMFGRVGSSTITDGDDMETEPETGGLGTPRLSDVTRTHATMSTCATPPPSVDVGPAGTPSNMLGCEPSRDVDGAAWLGRDVMGVSERIDDVLIADNFELGGGVDAAGRP